MAVTRRVHAIVRGRVQGVGFRWFACDAAERTGVEGWARNLQGGEVELEAQGEGAALERFLAELHQGPPAARVEAVEVREIAPAAEGQGFKIR